MSWHLRPATAADSAQIQDLIGRSIRALGAADYSAEQIEGALKGAFGLDSQLVADGTYFVVESEGRLVGCGGWSYRRTLFGGDARADRDAGALDPKVDAAKIRAFFVDPTAARQGIGTALLERCEAEAHRRGFQRTEMMATLPGVRLYEARGYVPGARVHYPLPSGLSIEFVPMSKELKDIAPQLVAEVTLYATERGGRQGPTPPDSFGCLCQLVGDDSREWDCRLLLHGSPIAPGETRRIEITFLSADEAVPAILETGRFYLWEGRIIGEAKVV